MKNITVNELLWTQVLDIPCRSPHRYKLIRQV